jgi:Nuclease-related domain
MFDEGARVASADGVDARARRVAARLLPARARRSTSVERAARHDLRRGEGAPRHRPGAHPQDGSTVLRALEALDQDGWVVLSDVQRPGTEQPVIDHVAIGPGGVIVVDSRHWVGRIEVTRGVVQQNGFWREQECAAVARTAGAVAALLLPQHRTAVHAFICVAQHDLPEHVVSPGVHVLGVSELGRALRALPYRLHPAEIAHLQTLLARTLQDADAPAQLTTAELDPGSGGPAGAHRDGSDPRPAATLFVPIAASDLRDAARSGAGRGGRSWWRLSRARVLFDSRPAVLRPSRLIAARLLLAALLAVAAVVVGPGLLRGAFEAGHSTSVPATSAPGPVPAVMPAVIGPGDLPSADPSPAASAT